MTPASIHRAHSFALESIQPTELVANTRLRNEVQTGAAKLQLLGSLLDPVFHHRGTADVATPAFISKMARPGDLVVVHSKA
ncbi:hypothetical protein N7537_010824 [Penicillium hordei]|jgi:hypothetical protein|uniref:Uncharacterized protein n=1 Tax=Penicillium hordei TaxID=40994 RepID=A0AAD6DKN8_9EURO|nr:uncharacterized protein N7537_010824 [Penicillium hordei]KAJ5588146.1 hypothetical protein N7537_010824 [Penicillium hordei]